MATADWVTVCSSTFKARAVIHSTKRRYPGRVKMQAKGWSSRCHADQRDVACGMGHLLLRCRGDGDHPAGSAQEMPRSRGGRGQEECRLSWKLLDRSPLSA